PAPTSSWTTRTTAATAPRRSSRRRRRATCSPRARSSTASPNGAPSGRGAGGRPNTSSSTSRRRPRGATRRRPSRTVAGRCEDTQARRRPLLAAPDSGPYSYTCRAAHNGAAGITQGEDRMNALRLLVAGAMVCAVTAGARAEDKKADNAKAILGSWEAVKADPGTLPVGAVVEFATGGKMKVTAKREGKEETH